MIFSAKKFCATYKERREFMVREIENLIVSSRVRLARNLENLPFKTKTKGVFDGVAATVKARNAGFVSTHVSDLSPDMARALFEQHLISRELVANKINSIIVARNDNKVVVMLGEEDHIRIQSMQTGLNLQAAYESVKKIAEDIAAEHKIAHRADFGYLTSCPTNLGTGMRASVMMFLPALTISNQIGGIIEELSNQNLTVRGVYGEGSGAGGYMYQISNQACLGMKESQIIRMVEEVTIQIAKLELKTQDFMYKEAPDELIDRVHRAWGLLTNAYMLSSAEAVDNLAVLKLGACLGIVKFKNVRILDDLFFITQPNTLVTVDERASSVSARDKIRAARVAEALRATRL
jgi:protein arginine kinase